MIITVRKKWVLWLFGWRTYPSYVTADHRLWLRWLTRGPEKNRKN